MRIAQIATCSGPVREDCTGSVESLIWLLARELTEMGHEVTTFACAGSEVAGELIVTQPGPYGINGAPSDWQLCDWTTISETIAQSERFDIIHSHAYLWALPLERFSRAPMVHTMHTMPYFDEAALWDRFPDARVTALSQAHWGSASPRAPYAIIHNGVDPAHFTFREDRGQYLCYLGRFIPGKGPLEAMSAARAVDMPLIIAGAANEYFRREISPYVDGKQVRYIGPVDRRQRDQLLGNALALLYPLHQPEPFGLVLVEAMMCGTPVVTTAVGAAPEIIADGISGVLASTHADIPAAIAAAAHLDRAAVHEYAKRFNCRTMAGEYSKLYASVAGSRAG